MGQRSESRDSSASSGKRLRLTRRSVCNLSLNLSASGTGVVSLMPYTQQTSAKLRRPFNERTRPPH